MEREKLLKYRGLAPIRFLNDFNAGLLTAEEYKLIREINKSDSWDKIDSYLSESISEESSSPPEITLASQKNQSADIKQKQEIAIVKSAPELKTDIRFKDNFFSVPNDVIDVLAPLQTPAEEVVYRRLFRQSYGWKRNYCRVSIPLLMKTCMIKSENTIRKALRGLIEKGHIAEYLNENGRIDTNNDGTLYIILLPEEIEGLFIGGSFFNGDANFEGALKFEGDAKNEPLQKLNPNAKSIVNKQSNQGDSKIEGANFEGGAKIEGANFEPPPPQKLRGSNFEPPLQMPENKHSKEGVQILRGANFEPIKYNNKDIFKNTLSQEEIISKFYECTGQKRITETKRERARECLKQMLKEGFSLEDVSFAIEWTMKNSKEKPYEFSFIQHTISQAMADKERVEAEKARQKEQEQIAIQEKAEEERLEKERVELEAFKEKLGPEERGKLRQKAIEEVNKMEGIKQEFITEVLIRSKENEILKAELKN
ncbi:hypothetical protein FJZ33_00290 [Candidatus Poribacteria bacterium]|nr:hypothetical protein [Candidatus Poribacteria bacterium]